MDIIFNPPVNDENRYVQLLVGELRAKGYRIHPLDTIFSSRAHFRSIHLVHLNWFENVDDRSFFVALRSFLRKLILLTVVRLSGKPLIWTLHNRMTHEKRMAFFSRAITRLLARWSAAIVVHSRQSKEVLAAYGPEIAARAVYIPHPHFIGVYGDAFAGAPVEADRLELLFIGMVKPYKNLELLMDVIGAFGHRVHLTVAGKAVDGYYRRSLAIRAKEAGNVTLLPYFIPDVELVELLGRSDVVVLPYDLASSLNSGTVILAFSYKKTVICPEIGTVSDLGNLMADTFCYHYERDDQHRKALVRQIERALALKRDQPAALVNRGTRLYHHVAAAYHPRRVGDGLDRLYRRVLDDRRH